MNVQYIYRLNFRGFSYIFWSCGGSDKGKNGYVVHLSLLQFCTTCVIIWSIAVFSIGQHSRLTGTSLMPNKMSGTLYMCLLMNEWLIQKLKKRLIEVSWIGVNISESSKGRNDHLSIYLWSQHLSLILLLTEKKLHFSAWHRAWSIVHFIKRFLNKWYPGNISWRNE